MTDSISLPATVEMRRSRLLAVVVAVAVVAAAVTWSIAAAAGSGSGQATLRPRVSVQSSLTPAENGYVKGIVSLTPVVRAAAFGGPGALLDAMRLTPAEKSYVEGITSLTPAQQAAAFGR